MTLYVELGPGGRVVTVEKTPRSGLVPLSFERPETAVLLFSGRAVYAGGVVREITAEEERAEKTGNVASEYGEDVGAAYDLITSDQKVTPDNLVEFTEAIRTFIKRLFT